MTYIPFDAAVVGNVDMPFLVVVVSDVGVGVRTIDAVVVMPRGNNATDGEVAADVRVGTVLEGVVGRSAIWTVWNRVVGE